MEESKDKTFHTLRAANVARQAEWDKDGGIDAAYRGNELAGEVGEACNVIKKLERERRGIRGSRASVEDLAAELADVVICTDLIAMQYGIDLDQAVADKFNATSKKVDLQTRMAIPALPREDALYTLRVLEGRLPTGHCGESTSEAIARGRAEDRYERIKAFLLAVAKPDQDVA